MNYQVCSLFLWPLIFLESMSAYCILRFFATFSLCDLQHTSLLTALLKLLSKTTRTLKLMTTSSWKVLFCLPETPICKPGFPHLSDFSSSCSCEHPLDQSRVCYFLLSFLWITHVFFWLQWLFYHVHLQCLTDVRHSANVGGRHVEDF